MCKIHCNQFIGDNISAEKEKPADDFEERFIKCEHEWVATRSDFLEFRCAKCDKHIKKQDSICDNIAKPAECVEAK